MRKVKVSRIGKKGRDGQQQVLYIPMEIAKEIGTHPGDMVAMMVDRGRIIIRPISQELDKLMGGE